MHRDKERKFLDNVKLIVQNCVLMCKNILLTSYSFDLRFQLDNSVIGLAIDLPPPVCAMIGAGMGFMN